MDATSRGLTLGAESAGLVREIHVIVERETSWREQTPLLILAILLVLVLVLMFFLGPEDNVTVYIPSCETLNVGRD